MLPKCSKILPIAKCLYDADKKTALSKMHRAVFIALDAIDLLERLLDTLAMLAKVKTHTLVFSAYTDTNG